MDYETSKKLAKDRDPEVRRKLAEREDLKPEILYYLAEDQSEDVRRAIARNPSSPRKADKLLTNDKNPEVRHDLAEKMTAQVIPELKGFAGSGDTFERLDPLTLDILRQLARDQAARVRITLAESIKGLDSIPPDIINTLARDIELQVARPILEHSPVLTDQDLIEIITNTPLQGALKAIAHRYNVSSRVSHSIAKTSDVEAITALLHNTTAQIQEETLDMILDQAPNNYDWHAPLSMRPKMPKQALERLASFVSQSFLEALRQRTDLDNDAANQLAKIIESRLKNEDSIEPKTESLSDGDIDNDIRNLKTKGLLTEDALQKALLEGRRRFVSRALSAAACLPPAMIEEIMDSQSPRGIIAMVWKAGFTMRLAAQLQLRLGRIAPEDVIIQKSDQPWPLTEKEMDWQLEFFERRHKAEPTGN